MDVNIVKVCFLIEILDLELSGQANIVMFETDP